MANIKIPNVAEVTRWLEEGQLTYHQIIDKIEEQYGVRVGYSTIVDLNRRAGLPPRLRRHDALLPWEIKPEHRRLLAPKMLRALGKRRAGEPIGKTLAINLDNWLARRAADDTVVHYQPDTEQGWFYVPRREGVDTDIIRVPDRVTRTRTARDQQPESETAHLPLQGGLNDRTADLLDLTWHKDDPRSRRSGGENGR